MPMGTPLTIEQAETCQPDLVKGQVWSGAQSNYFYRCPTGHPDYRQQYNNHHTGTRCPVCYALSPRPRQIEVGLMIGRRLQKEGRGLFGMTLEQKSAAGQAGGIAGGSIGRHVRWCTNRGITNTKCEICIAEQTLGPGYWTTLEYRRGYEPTNRS